MIILAKGPSITDWISAISTAALGVIGLVFATWQWRANGFRPKLSARMDQQREAIELRVTNRGRGLGVVEEVLVLRPGGDGEPEVEDVQFEGFVGGEFKPVSLPGLASARLLIQAMPGKYIPKNAALRVYLGQTEGQEVKLVTETDVSLYGLKSILPPGNV